MAPQASSFPRKCRQKPHGTSLYVRMRVPDALVQEVNNPNELTNTILKYGISFKVDARDITYNHKIKGDPDNGYMAYSFECDSRAEAAIIEKILRVKFAGASVLNSWEYVDVAKVAKVLGHPQVIRTYGDYEDICRKLFIHIVETVKVVFPDKYLGKYGIVYEAVGKSTSVQKTGMGKDIDISLATQFGFRTPSITWTPLSLENYEPVLERIETGLSFKNVPVFSVMDNGEELYKIACDKTQPSNEACRVGKKLHEYAINMWQIPPSKIDEEFYNEYVKPHDALATFNKALRFVIMKTSSIQDIEHAMNKEIDCATSSLVKVQLRAHYSILIAAKKLLSASVTSDQADAMSNFENVTVTTTAIDEACSLLKAGVAPEARQAFNKLFNVKAGVTSFVLFRKILTEAFGIIAARKDKRANMKGYHFVDISLNNLADFAKKYSPCILTKSP